ncbi:uncharacterized protein FIBRA_03958 [Fibroporia radiculosa]|uniref:DUF4243 domain-containing protein n=1 Tax=Fibroporia radiculosa TaxID=599839 RepID=J4HW98_9APHY|nr:uncharacterized protein FIBRA_03958 [Fibroporia radiculosa]CCM01887.1 predicted protein [Fibroporia radiculosa]
MVWSLAPTITQGILNIPGATAQSKATAERILEEDRATYHCLWGRVGLHNHLSHHILAAYDFGASSPLLQAIYDKEKSGLSPIHLADRQTGAVEEQLVQITSRNWTKFLGDEKYYAKYLTFFSNELAQRNVGEVFELYIFEQAANRSGAYMLSRFLSGAVHPIIQTGYGVEFGSIAMVAQGLAQTAIHSPFVPELFDLNSGKYVNDATTETAGSPRRQPARGSSLLAILREAYDSPIMVPVMPYDPNAFLRVRIASVLADPMRLAEIRRLAAKWCIDVRRGQQELDDKVEELLWLTTLLLASTGKRDKSPRLDFFLMHMLNMSIFIPSLLAVIPTMESKATLLRSLIPVLLMYLTIRGRPRIDPELLLSYTETPCPPGVREERPHSSSIGDSCQTEFVNPWPAIVASVLHAPDPHTLKAIRALYYAAQQYGRTPAGGAIGAFDAEGKETHKGMASADGTIFVRAAGVVMDTLGWVTHGQKAGNWDSSALGWDDAWKDQ